MFSGIVSNISRERAEMCRDIEFIRENLNDSKVQEALLINESCNCGIYRESDIVSSEEEKLIMDAIDQMPDDNFLEEATERILTSTKKNLSIDDVLGVNVDGDDMDATDYAYDMMISDD